MLDKLLSAATTNAKLVLAAAAGAALVAGGGAVAITSVSDSGASEQGLSASELQGENRSDTATAKIAVPKPSKSPKADKVEGERKDNHGACVSAVAKATPAADADPNAHGKLVSETAKSDCGKTAGGSSAEAKKKAADKKAERTSGTDDDADDDGSPSSTGVERSGGRAGGK